MKKAFIFFLSFVSIILFISSCKEEKKKLSVNLENLQNECVHRLTDIIVYDIFSPPVASRIYAYSNLAYYEAIRFKDSSTGISIAVQMHGFGVLPNQRGALVKHGFLIVLFQRHHHLFIQD